MKHRLFALGLLMVSVPAISHAQQMMAGVRGGVNLGNQYRASNTFGLFSENISFHAGLLGGIQFDQYLDDKLAISVQALFDQKGAHAEMYGLADGPLPSGTANWTGNYIEIPLLVKMRTGVKPWRPYIFAGPSIGFLLSNIEHSENSGFPPSVNITDSTNKIDFSIVVGGGVSVTLISGPILFLDVSYAFGLVNTDNYNYDEEDGLSIYSRDIRLAAGILCPLP
jgi:hypothetical protein